MAVVEYDNGKAIVRIHSGKLTEEERKKVLEDAAKQFFKAIEKAHCKDGRMDSIFPVRGADDGHVSEAVPDGRSA